MAAAGPTHDDPKVPIVGWWWRCARCGTENWYRRRLCRHCEEPRELSEAKRRAGDSNATV